MGFRVQDFGIRLRGLGLRLGWSGGLSKCVHNADNYC